MKKVVGKVIVVGDIHGDFGALNMLINKKSPDVVVQCGDNAYFWSDDYNGKGKIKPGNCKVFLVPGNHENWDEIEAKVGRRGREPVEIDKNVFFCPIGSTLKINSFKCMFIGGADSIDKGRRTIGLSWWPQEVLNQCDLDFCVQHNEKIDMVFSHTCPFDFQIFERLQIYDKANDSTMQVLNAIFNDLKPERWYFGHWHDFVQGQVAGCKFWGLNCVSDNKWWMNVQ